MLDIILYWIGIACCMAGSTMFIARSITHFIEKRYYVFAFYVSIAIYFLTFMAKFIFEL